MPISPTRMMFEEEVLPRVRGRTLVVGVRDYCRYDIPDSVSLDIDADAFPDIVADICDTKLQPDQFDTVVCFGVIRYCRDPFAAVAEIRRLLKPGGKALFGLEFNGPPDGVDKYGGDKWRFTPEGVKALLKDFDIAWMMPFESKTIFVEAVKRSGGNKRAGRGAGGVSRQPRLGP